MIRQSDWMLLCSLYQYKSITKASEVLYMTQPAITKRLKQLESEFGIQIAQRNAKGLVFTSKGEYLAKYAQRMLEEYSELEKMIADPKEVVFGKLHIATCGSLARFLLPDLLGCYKQTHEEVDFEVSSDFSYKVSQMINTQKASIGFLRGEHVNGCCKKLLGTHQACAVSSRPFALEDLPYLPRIDFYSDQFASSSIDSWWYTHFDTPPIIAMTVQSGSTCYEMVKNGLGYAIYLSDDFIKNKEGLHIIPLYDLNGNPVVRNDWMIYREKSLELDLVRSFVEFADQYFARKAASQGLHSV